MAPDVNPSYSASFKNWPYMTKNNKMQVSSHINEKCVYTAWKILQIKHLMCYEMHINLLQECHLSFIQKELKQFRLSIYI